ncbi:MAG: zinc ABC transporter substrate-binding protein [Candidatus Aminicenantes bacterium]|nr:zinc ABC transporter substrate-binding protein [Candidatus Aminicenantes bacterium]
MPMPKRWTVYLWTVLGFIFGGAVNASAGVKVRIETSVFPLREFAASVAGERGEVRLLLPPGAGVHTWQPRAGDLIRLAECDLFIYVGADLEPWVPDVLRGLGGRKIETLDAARRLDLIREPEDAGPGRGGKGHGAFDPHVWLDLELAGRIVDLIRDRLSEIDPEGAPVYGRNAAAFRERLRVLDLKFKTELGACPRKTFILAGHAAFGYLARRYGLEQVALYGLSPDSQPTPGKFTDVVGLARELGIKVIFFEAAASPDVAKALSRELGARTLVLNPGHNLTRAEITKGVGFFDIMEENLRNLKDGLGCR